MTRIKRFMASYSVNFEVEVEVDPFHNPEEIALWVALQELESHLPEGECLIDEIEE